jgi:hypothetical protein
MSPLLVPEFALQVTAARQHDDHPPGPWFTTDTTHAIATVVNKRHPLIDGGVHVELRAGGVIRSCVGRCIVVPAQQAIRQERLGATYDKQSVTWFAGTHTLVLSVVVVNVVLVVDPHGVRPGLSSSAGGVDLHRPVREVTHLVVVRIHGVTDEVAAVPLQERAHGRA